MDGHQTQSRRHPSVGKHIECGTLVIQQSFRYSEYHADDAIVASRTAHCAVVTVDDHGICRLGRGDRRSFELAVERHLAAPF